ncbi:hypothetical protein GCM10009801_14730 [Streptomyces albiaxialis]|uniref:Uncharacterized protein n=1 Tax=Streptomyces albiaxialis TaxID=329523 RepID=A0ABN2VNS2_9ACTN
MSAGPGPAEKSADPGPGRLSRPCRQDWGRLPWFALFLRRAFFLRRRLEDMALPFRSVLSATLHPFTGVCEVVKPAPDVQSAG